MQERLRVGVAVERPRDAVLRGVEFSGHEVGPQLVRLEESTEPVVIDLRGRVVLVVVALRAVERQPEDALAGVLDDLVQPRRPVEQEVRPGEVAGGPELLRVGRV